VLSLFLKRNYSDQLEEEEHEIFSIGRRVMHWLHWYHTKISSSKINFEFSIVMKEKTAEENPVHFP
jgi:hypothetical protein